MIIQLRTFSKVLVLVGLTAGVLIPSPAYALRGPNAEAASTRRDLRTGLEEPTIPQVDATPATAIQPLSREETNRRLRALGVGDVNDLSDVDLDYQDLSGFDLSNRTLERTSLVGAKLVSTNLRGALMTKAYLTGAHLRGADLRDAKLKDARLPGADLTDANARGADFTDASMEDVILTDADLRGADLTHVSLMRATMTRAKLEKATMVRAVLPHTDLTDAHLADADLTDAILTRAILTRTDLTFAILTNANWAYATLVGANLTDATGLNDPQQLVGARWDATTRWPMGFDSVQIPMARIHPVVYGTTDTIVEQLNGLVAAIATLGVEGLTADMVQVVRLNDTTPLVTHSIVVTQNAEEARRLIDHAERTGTPLAAAVPVSEATSLTNLFGRAVKTFTPTFNVGTQLQRVRRVGDTLAIYY